MYACKYCLSFFDRKSKAGRPQEFCRRYCRDTYFGRIRNGEDPNFSKLIDISCIVCNKLFKTGNSVSSKKKYCSYDCYIKRNKKPDPHPISCGLCGQIFKIKRHVPAKYCSDKCRSLARYRKMTGYPIKSPRTRSEYGKGYINKQGYRVVYRDHPNANSRTRIILEHIFLKSQEIGRPLRKGETVHHKNGIRSDNRPENLELWTSRHPSGMRHEEKIKSAIAFLEEEGYKVVK